ncbi:MAG TPA: LacI family DNA-binding transcriptional regulator [Chthonomonadaceae bacterium]|nr:LacI family DNA-binding transcriptional regulator [Chthonomonadaceae bacterium]
MESRRVRMIDVAKAAGVSRTTVSFVLSGRDAGIPAETKQRVLRLARQMGYRPHDAALALATGRTRRIGLVLNDPTSFIRSDSYVAHVLSGVLDGTLKHNYNLLLHSARYTDWHALYGEILSGAADGTLLVGRFERDELTPALLEAGVPVVCVSYQIEHPDCYSVDCDNEQGGYLAVRHVIERGHRQIAFFSPGETISWGRDRLLGARRALVEAGLSEESLRVFVWQEAGLPSAEWTQEALSFLLALNPRPTALVCCEEWRIRQVVEALPAMGMRVPEELVVVSFNSTEHSARCRPPLTSVAQPLEQIGSAAVDMLIKRIEGRKLPERHRRFPVRLDVRESTQPDPSLAVISDRKDIAPPAASQPVPSVASNGFPRCNAVVHQPDAQETFSTQQKGR